MQKSFFLYLLFLFVVVASALEKKDESEDLSFLYKTKQFFKNETFTIGTGVHYFHNEDIKDAMASIMPLNFNIGYFINDVSFTEFEYLFHAKNLGYAGHPELIQRFHNIHLKYRYIPFKVNSEKLHGLLIGSTFEFMQIKTNHLSGGNHTQSNISVDAGFLFSVSKSVMFEVMYRYPVIYFDDTGKPVKIKNARDASGLHILLKYKF